MEEAPKKYFRLTPGKEVRLQHAFFVTCTRFEKDESGKVTKVYATYDPETRGGNAPDGRKVKGTLHWVSASHAVQAEVRLYDRLFLSENPDDVGDGGTYLDNLNPDSCSVLSSCYVEPMLANPQQELPYQFLRHGYFIADSKESRAERPVFNQTVGLRDSWAKEQGK